MEVLRVLAEIWRSLEPMERRYLRIGALLIAVFGFLSIFVLPFLFTRAAIFDWMDFSQTGQIGDTVNGIATPFIALLAAALTFLAFYVQYKANVQQREQFESQLRQQREQFALDLDRQKAEQEEQEKTQRLDRFETKYFELIRLHKENVNEIKVGDLYFGRDAFVGLYNELRLCFWGTKYYLEQFWGDASEAVLGFAPRDDEQILRISYLVFFNGIGDSSERLWFEHVRTLCSLDFSEQLLQYIKNQQPGRTPHSYHYEFKNGTVFKYDADFKPFVGHVSRLGHYYRHLYQTVRYVDEASDLSPEQKYSYLKTLRAQLSSYEQILLYYNTFSPFGSPWIAEEHPYIARYRLIKNIPLPLADFGVKPEERFKQEVERTKDSADKFFEWHEV